MAPTATRPASRSVPLHDRWHPSRLTGVGVVALALGLAMAPAACAHPPSGDATTRGVGSASLPWLTAQQGGGEQSGAADGGDGLPFPVGAVTVPEQAPGPLARALGKFLAARAAQQANDISAAADNYAAALEADPENRELGRRTYYYLAAAGRFEEAVAVAERVLQAAPDDDFAPLLLAARAMSEDDPEAAAAALESMDSTGLNALFKPLLGGWAALGRGETLAAVLDELDQADTLSSAEPLMQLHAALMARVADDQEVSRARLDAYLADTTLDSPRAALLVAALLVWQGRPQEARDLVDRQLNDRPGSLMLEQLAARLDTPNPLDTLTALPSNAREGFAEALYHGGLVVNQGPGSDTAIVLFRLARAVRPDFPMAGVAIGETLRRMERFEDADRVLAEVNTSGDPALDYLVRLYRAENLEFLERIDEALESYEALAEDRPDQTQPLVDMGDLLRREERFAEAAAAYGRALESMPEGAANRWTILYRRGIAYERAGQWPKAEADFLQTLELEQDHPEVLNYLGYSWLDRGEHIERAVDMILEAVRQRPRDGYIVDSLGWGYYLLGRYDEAVEELERAVELRPQDSTINDHLGDAYWRVGRRLEARFQWERALSLEPDPDHAEALTRKLKEGLGEADPRIRPDREGTR